MEVNGQRMLLDIAWPSFHYTIDLDGAKFHAKRFDEDRERDVNLRTAGWTVDRFTWLHATTRMPWLLHTGATSPQRTRLDRRLSAYWVSSVCWVGKIAPVQLS